MREIEASLAARLCRAGVLKSSIVKAFTQSVANSTSFIDELYAFEGIDETSIARCIADETGLVFEEMPADANVIVPTGPQFVTLRGLRHTTLLTLDDTILIYMAPTLRDIAVIKANLPKSPDTVARLRITTATRLAEFLRSNHEKFLAEGAVRMVRIQVQSIQHGTSRQAARAR